MADQDSGYCSNCAALEAQVAQLQAQVAHLQRENEELRRMVERLKRVLEWAKAQCRGYIAQTRETLDKSSGVPRARWAYCRGAYEVAYNVLAILQGGA